MSYFRMPVLFCQEEKSGNFGKYANSTCGIDEGSNLGTDAALSQTFEDLLAATSGKCSF
jgi:hypothetical protein